MKLLSFVFLLCCFRLAAFTDAQCTVELECRECMPDNMPMVTSHRAADGTVVAANGDEVTLACAGGKFLLYPLRDTVATVCERGRFRVGHDGTLRHLLELGCQENIYEDVQHQVEDCGGSLTGRAYQTQEAGSRATRHLATLCFDADRAIAVRAHVCNAPRNQLRMPPHNDESAPLSLLGNFNHMFDAKTRSDAQQLYSDDTRMNRRLHELFKHERVTFADQTLTSAKLLSGHYFDDQNMRVTDFVSNHVPVWKSVASGNLRHLQHDVAKLMKLTRPETVLDVYTGTSGVLSLRSGHSRTEVYLKPGKRFPVPKYIWTLVHDKVHQKALAIVLLNDPFVAVSEIRDVVFCESACGSVSWLHELRRNRNYESPVLGLVFCCGAHNFTDIVAEMPRGVVAAVPGGASGVFTELFHIP